MEANRRCCWNHFLSMCADFTELHLNAPSLNSHALCWAVQVKWGRQVGVFRWSEGVRWACPGEVRVSGGRGSAGDWRFHASVEINDHFSVFYWYFYENESHAVLHLSSESAVGRGWAFRRRGCGLPSAVWQTTHPDSVNGRWIESSPWRLHHLTADRRTWRH